MIGSICYMVNNSNIKTTLIMTDSTIIFINKMKMYFQLNEASLKRFEKLKMFCDDESKTIKIRFKEQLKILKHQFEDREI